MTLASGREARLPIAKVAKTACVVVQGAGSRTTGNAKVLAGEACKQAYGDAEEDRIALLPKWGL